MAEAVENGGHVRYSSESNTPLYRLGAVISVTRATPVRRRENTRARLLEAAVQVFADQGIRRVTVDDLVGAAGFTRGAFYSNFESIDELFFAVFEQQSRLMIDAVRETVDAVPDGEFTTESISLLLDSVMPYARTWYLIQAEFTLLALRSPEAREVFTGHHHQLEQEMAELIGDIVRRLGRVPTVPIEKVTEVAIALYLHSLAHEGLGTGALDPASLVEDVLPQVLLGLSRPAE